MEQHLPRFDVLLERGVIERRTYDLWGAISSDSGALGDSAFVGWKGLLWEGDSTRLYYAQNRWYDPNTGRFVSEDPIGIAGGLNAYVFVGDDPVNGSDPSGLFGFCGALMGPCIGGHSVAQPYSCFAQVKCVQRGGRFLPGVYLLSHPVSIWRHLAIMLVPEDGRVSINELEGWESVGDALHLKRSKVHLNEPNAWYDPYYWDQIGTAAEIPKYKTALRQAQADWDNTHYEPGDSNLFAADALARANSSVFEDTPDHVGEAPFSGIGWYGSLTLGVWSNLHFWRSF